MVELLPHVSGLPYAMKLLLVAWFLFMASASFWLPAYEGDLGSEPLIFLPAYAFVVVVAAVGVRGRAQSRREALFSTLPAVGVLAAAIVVGYLVNEGRAEYRGGPLFLFFALALWGSWTVLMTLSALALRTRWSDLMGMTADLVIAALGLIMFTARID